MTSLHPSVVAVAVDEAAVGAAEGTIMDRTMGLLLTEDTAPREVVTAAAEVAEAKLWAADAGHRIAHTTVHVHGGVGIDLDGEAHRYFTRAKVNEFTLGGATDQARHLGRLLAVESA